MRISDWSSDVCSSDLKIDSSRHVPYKGQNIEIRQSIPFAKWMDGLKDRRARVRIADRLKRLAAGNAGDSKPVGDGVQELRFDFGPGYRIYYIWSGGRLIILLMGGDKSSQTRDLQRARALATR